jgi:hypothetical protein
MTDSFGLFTSNRYISPYVTLVGQGTYTDQNPYVLDQSYATIIDHVLHKGGYKAVDAKVRSVFSKQLCCSKSLKKPEDSQMSYIDRQTKRKMTKNICITNDHGYVPLVANTSRSFPHS